MAPGASLARRVRRAGAAWLLCAAVATWGCGGEVLNLGSSGLQAGGASGTGGGVAAHIWDLNSTPIIPQVEHVLLANPTLTRDESNLFYSEQERFGNLEPFAPRIKHAVWNSASASWGSSTELMLGSLKMPDVSSPAISESGTELWLGMLNEGNKTDIFKSELQAGAWTTPLRVAELCSSDDDAPRPPAVAGTIMPLSSKRHDGPSPLYQIYLSTRENENAVWSEPSKALLGPVNSDAFQSADGFLDRTGLELYFSSTRDGDHTDSDLYVSRRVTLTDVFGEPEALTDLNDPQGRSEERMPWLSSDGKLLYFVSDRTGQYTLYLATKL
jgi:hypothetical protein